MEKNLTFDEIDAHVKSLRLSDYQSGGIRYFKAVDVTTDPGSVLQRVCGIYNGIRPILKGLSNLPLIPEKWRDAIKTFMSLMDTLCAG